jgi:hypothetical protein
MMTKLVLRYLKVLARFVVLLSKKYNRCVVGLQIKERL